MLEKVRARLEDMPVQVCGLEETFALCPSARHAFSLGYAPRLRCSHPTENARRRDPRIYNYAPVPCPAYKKGICLRGDACSYSHGVYEAWLHPAKYRTQLCKEGLQCRRPVCFFAHSLEDLRQPTLIKFADDEGSEFSAHSKTDVFNNLSESGQATGSEGSSSDSGRNNNCQEDCPGTPPATRKAQGTMPTTGEVSMLSIGSPGSLLPDDVSEGSGVFNNGMMNGYLNGSGAGYANGHASGYSAGANPSGRRSADYPLSSSAAKAQDQPFAATAGPRMSQAVARKLGLAPTRSASNASSMSNGVVSPPRRSYEAPARRGPVDYRRSADVWLERDLLNAMAFNKERVVVGGGSSGGDSRGQSSSSLVHAMNGIENSHKAVLQQQGISSADSLSSLISSLSGMAMSTGNQDVGFSGPLHLDEFGNGMGRE